MIASIRMTPRIHHVFGSHAQELLGILFFKFTEWTFNHSLARKTKKQERETEMLKQAEVQSEPEGQATPSVKRQASKNAIRVPKRPAIDPIRPKRLSRLICAYV